MPYAVTDGSGHLLWMNREFTAILEEDKNSYKNITAVFPEITKEMLATGGEVVSIHSCLGDRKFRIDLKQVMVDSLDAAVAAGGLEGQAHLLRPSICWMRRRLLSTCSRLMTRSWWRA